MRAPVAIGLICLFLVGCETGPQNRSGAAGPSAPATLHVTEVKAVPNPCDLSGQRLSAVGGGALGAVLGFGVCRLATEVLARKSGTADKNRLSAGCAVAGSIVGYTWAADTARRRCEVYQVAQTTRFDASLQQTITTATRTNMGSGTQFTLATFSAFLGDHYTDIVVAGRTEGPLSQAERDDTSKPKLRNLDVCLAHQIDYARRLSEAALEKSFGGASAAIARSDILASLYDFATHVVQPSPAKSKILLMASDMLENSSLSSFYAHRAVRKLDPGAELDKVRQKGLIPDLTGVRIFVVGAGVLDPQSAATYRDPQTMLSLEGFWSAYFQAAHAQLVEFGKPQLLGQVQ